MHLPEKTLAQINNQTQRFLGQQATREFHLMKVNLDAVNEWNAKKVGPNIFRKNGCIINSGNKLEKKEVLQLQVEHNRRFGLSKEYIRHIVIPTVTGENTKSLMVEGDDLAEGWLSFRQQKLKRLASMEVALERLQKQLAEFGASMDDENGDASKAGDATSSATDSTPTSSATKRKVDEAEKTSKGGVDDDNETAATTTPSSTTASGTAAKGKGANKKAKKTKTTGRKATKTRKASTKKKNSRKRKTQEQLDAELAAKLQAEEDAWGY